MQYHLGLDIGSISINTVLMDDERTILENHYTYCHGRPFHVLLDILTNLVTRHGVPDRIALTGTGGALASELIGGHFVNEIVAQSASISSLFPEAKTVIEMGGEDSKLILMDRKENSEKSQLADFAMNSICAAGTGSFLDQQARRIGISIEKEFGELAMKSVSPPRIAGRCSVFAKSDMIHLQQIATPVEDIVAGLCFAVARNFKSSLARGKTLAPPIVFQGGVAANLGVVRAFREVLGLDETELIIPEYYASMGAIGALYQVLDNPPDEDNPYQGLESLAEYLTSEKTDIVPLEPLEMPSELGSKETVSLPENGDKLDVYLGLDIGSLSTNVVLIDEKGNVVARRYLPTASKPLDAIRRGLSEIYEEVGNRVEVLGAGTTGSGRYLTGDFIGADTIQNEITAQATAAIAYDPTVDTIFEIGGQDSKYIKIDDGVVVDFEMNKVCAAGTGSFLEEQAEKLDINIVGDFERYALECDTPCRLGDRCTVFMESDLNSHQQKGAKKEDLIAGLAYSIVHNYIQKVVGEKRIGDRIFFQGGVTNNRAVVAAFEKVTGKSITVPPHFDVTGAIGAAMLARDAVKNGSTRFKGFDVSRTPFTLDRFTCKSCPNQCEIRRVRIEGEKKPLYYGGRCEKWEIEERKGRGKGIPNLFEERTKLLLGDFEEEPRDERISIGLPRGLMLFYGQFPFWKTFFRKLGFRVVLSRPSDRQLITQSLEMLSAETCFPVEVIHGHVHDLLEKDVDFVFMPFIITSVADENNPTVNYNCPWIQTFPFMIQGAFRDDPRQQKFLIPTLHFRYGSRVLEKQLAEYMKERFGMSPSKVRKAVREAENAQDTFESSVRERGREAMNRLPQDKISLVILGRPYNTGDPELNLRLIEKLINLDVLPIPIDFLPLQDQNVFQNYPMMYWPNGQKILGAAQIAAKNPRLHAVYLGNFRCGPDSFLSHFVREEMKGKPYLQLEVDEHSADAGMITRCEAFLDSLKGEKEKAVAAERTESPNLFISHSDPNRVLYFPYMNDVAYAIAAASRSCGVNAQVLPKQDERDIELGRQYTSSRECFPMICTTGSFLRKTQEPGFDPKKSSFFMPDHNGPCRFGQYNRLQRIIFDRLGLENVAIISPANDNSYADLSGGNGIQFRLAAWRGIVASDLLRKLRQEWRPYEMNQGDTDKTYGYWLERVVESIEKGGRDVADVLTNAVEAFRAIPVIEGPRKPLIAVIGEIFMRDNPYCSGFLVDRLEALGAETIIAPFREWIAYSSYRWGRDSLLKRDWGGLAKSKIQETLQNHIAHRLERVVEDTADMDKEVSLREMLDLCGPYVHKHYDGDPALAFGAAAKLAREGVSGIANILPFTCMPGTLITSVSGAFRKDHDNIPWVNIAYDGQDDIGIETRLQAFMHQAREFAREHTYNEPREWPEMELPKRAAVGVKSR